MENILDVKNVCKENILDEVSFQVKKGEMVAIMGPSGSGKSTLLYMVSGMDYASSGEIVFDNQNINVLDEEEKAHIRLTKMGFVFQQMNMLKNLNIRDNILLASEELDHSTKGRKAAYKYAAELMKKMGIEELADREITEVSGGQLQRACICRSMMNQPEILFADEPTGALNQSATNEVMDELHRVNQEGTTILMVTHDSKVASKCEHILYILDGKLMGELELGKWNVSSTQNEKVREERVNQWLINMGW